MSGAKREDWKTLDAPTLCERLDYKTTIPCSAKDKLLQGLRPRVMEDKWFIYFEEGWLYFHRSWTGILIYWVRLLEDSDYFRVSESWVNRDPTQYGETDKDYDQKMLDFLIHRLLLEQNAPFPIREKDISKLPKGVFQHHIVGRAYPEKRVSGSEESELTQ